MSRQGPVGLENISLMMIAPSGGGGSSSRSGPPSGLRVRTHSAASGEYQTSTGAWVPKFRDDHSPSRRVATRGPARRMPLSWTQPAASLRWQKFAP